jgi:hypothetical protein
MKKSIFTKTVLALAIAMPLAASAESNFVTGAGALSANARLDFRIIIPKVLFLQVGTGAYFTNNATVNLVDFDMSGTPANVGNGVAVASTPASVAVRVVGNNGNITLNATTLGALGNGAGDTISYTQITGTSDNANLNHPAAFVDGGTSANVTIVPNIGTKVTDRSANWSFTYANTAVPPPGTYGGVNTNNSRVTYTASMP